MDTRGRRTVVAGLVTLALLVPGACSREFGGAEQNPQSGRPADVAVSPEIARQKLDLVLGDPCQSAEDLRASWPRCGRWEEEAGATARGVGQLRAGDARAAAAVAGVAAGHDAFVGGGCTAAGAGPAVDPRACIGAVLRTRGALTDLDRALGPVGS